MKKDKFIQLFSNLINKKDASQESESVKISPQDAIAQYLQEKQANGGKLNAKDYFAKDILENNAEEIFVDTLKTMLGVDNVRGGSICNNWSDSIKYASVSATVFDYVEEGVLIILGVSGIEQEYDTVDVFIGKSDDPDTTLELGTYPNDVEDASSIYSNAADKVIDFLLSKEIL